MNRHQLLQILSKYAHTSAQFYHDQIVLRPVSDMTPEEQAHVFEIKQKFDEDPYFNQFECYAEITSYLESCKIDVHGLIKAGYALDEKYFIQ